MTRRVAPDPQPSRARPAGGRRAAAGPVLWMVGYNSGVLGAVDDLLPPASVQLFEERDLWVGKELERKVWRHASLAAATFARYQQDDGFIEVARRLGGEGLPDAVVAGLEYAVPAAAAIAEHFGLPGAGVDAARTLCDKLRLRAAQAAAGMPVPRWEEVHGPDDVAAFAGGGACVLKPAQRQASLGVLLLEPGADPHEAWRECVGVDEGRQVAHRPMSWRYLVEERMEGPEFSTECLVTGGRLRFVNVTAKRTLPGRHPVELGHTLPAADGRPGSDWHAAAAELVRAVGFSTGILHAEWIVTGAGPRLVECAARPPGDRILELVDLAYGTNITWSMVQALAGRDVGDPPAAGRFAAIRFLTAGPGRIEALEGAERARALPGVERVDLLKTVGDDVTGTASSWDRVASAVATGPSAAAAEERAAAALDALAVRLA